MSTEIDLRLVLPKVPGSAPYSRRTLHAVVHPPISQGFTLIHYDARPIRQTWLGKARTRWHLEGESVESVMITDVTTSLRRVPTTVQDLIYESITLLPAAN